MKDRKQYQVAAAWLDLKQRLVCRPSNDAPNDDMHRFPDCVTPSAVETESHSQPLPHAEPLFSMNRTTHAPVLARATNLVVLAAALASFNLAAHADERRFTYSYEATVLPVGEAEFEQWVTWKTDKETDSSFNRFDFREEFELGITEKLQAGFYVSDWRVEHTASGTQTTWRNAAVELIYSLSDPTVNPIGVAVYGEVAAGPELLRLETKLLLQHNVGAWMFVWNGTVEAVWNGDDLSNTKGEFKQTLGASYQIMPSLTVGAELLWEIDYNHWSTWEDGLLYMGPNASYRSNQWWITATPMMQVTGVTNKPEFQLRVIFGINF